MSIYNLPETNKNKIIQIILVVFLCVFLSVVIFKVTDSGMPNVPIAQEVVYIYESDQESMVMNAVEESMPSVVSIIIKKSSSTYFDDLFFERFFKDDDVLKQVGAGTGFIVSEDGLIITNKHVVEDETAVYSILTNDGETYDVEVLAKNPVQDIAILRIIDGKDFKALKLGDSSSLRLGQSVIAIGNALGEFQNSVSLGVLSGLQRNVLAQGSSKIETLEDILQTDAAINRGNSGGPLLNLKGEVIGINTAVSMDGENIGFAIPINKAKRDLDQVLTLGKIAYPFIGISYILIDEEYAKEEGLPLNHGAYIIPSKRSEPSSIVPNSPADKAFLKEGDIVLEFDHQKISKENTLTKIIQNYFPNDEVVLKIFRNSEEILIPIVLGDWSDF